MDCWCGLYIYGGGLGNGERDFCVMRLLEIGGRFIHWCGYLDSDFEEFCIYWGGWACRLRISLRLISRV